jgi:hypothetical protein
LGGPTNVVLPAELYIPTMKLTCTNIVNNTATNTATVNKDTIHTVLGESICNLRGEGYG